MRQLFALMTAGLFLFLPFLESQAQSRYWVEFTDRGPDTNERLSAFQNEFTSLRLAKSGGRDFPSLWNNIPLTIDDLPPAEQYIQAVINAGAQVHVRSRWLNAVSVSANAAALVQIQELPFVASVKTVGRWRLSEPETQSGLKRQSLLSRYGLDYGLSLQQLEMIHVPEVHDVWIDGTDIIVGMLDNGYRWRVHEAFASTYIYGEYDVINGDSLTENSPTDPQGQDAHGTLTFSTLGSFKEGVLIGPAFNAAFLLAKTEINGSETQIEEDNWVEGMEWLDMRGASVVSASLGYLDWDDGTGYSWERGDFDGKTAVTSRAAIAAARRGILLVTAMGNEGQTPGSLIAPADADSVVAVGAVTFENTVANFSSMGPTSDRRIKPDVVAPGVNVFCANRNGVDTYQLASGTSLATPLTAGVAALIRSARPELSPAQLREALRNTADNAQAPDNRRGWGLIDAWKALLYHGMVISTNPKVFWSGTQSIVMVWVLSPNEIVGTVELYYSTNDRSGSVSMILSEEYTGLSRGSGRYTAVLPAFPEGTEVRFHISASDIRELRTSPYGAPDRKHRIITGEQRTSGAANLLPASYSLYQSYPNPLESTYSSSATIRYDVPVPGAHIRIVLYDALGRYVRTLVDAARSVGQYSVTFDAAGLSSGRYYYALFADDTRLFGRMQIIQ